MRFVLRIGNLGLKSAGFAVLKNIYCDADQEKQREYSRGRDCRAHGG
ncbi:MAG: hypothetical protein KGY42_04415 [Desulfobacterales bacterium]|nr:hypothetical protein [Desulfobacterales bacterium]